MSRPDHPLFFAIADGVLRRIGVLAGFDLDKNKRGALPGDYIDFAVLGTVAGGHNPVTERPDVINGQDLGSAAECQKAMKKKRKRQGLRTPRNRLGNRVDGEIRLFFVDHQRRTEANG